MAVLALALLTDDGADFHTEPAIVAREDFEILQAWALGDELSVSLLNVLSRIDPESIALRDARLAAARARGDRLHPLEDPWAMPLQPAAHGATASA